MLWLQPSGSLSQSIGADDDTESLKEANLIGIGNEK